MRKAKATLERIQGEIKQIRKELQKRLAGEVAGWQNMDEHLRDAKDSLYHAERMLAEMKDEDRA